MNVHLVLLLAYSALLVAVGLWLSRRVHGADDFFVAGRRLGPGLVGATVLAANIGAGSTVGAAALGYRDGLSAWWWVGSAGMGSIVLAWWVGPAIRRVAARYDLRTVGDFLEWRYGPSVRTLVAAVLWIATLLILAGQLLAAARVLEAVTGVPKVLGSLIAGVVMTTYFAAGGLLTSAGVNIVQLGVLLTGFVIAVPMVWWGAGGLDAMAALQPTADYWSVWRGGASGWPYVIMLAPAFVVSPGLLQKVYGARDDRAVRLGVGVNAVVLLLFAFLPVLLGMLARARHPALLNADLALPTLLVTDLPPAVGSLFLAALFSAEISTADAILFMLSTSLAQDLYRRFVNREAGDRQVLRVARGAAVLGGTCGVVLAATVAESVIDALSVFYAVMTVSLAVPLVVGLFTTRPGSAEALSSIVGGVSALAVAYVWSDGTGFGVFSPTLIGLCVAALAFAASSAMRARRISG